METDKHFVERIKAHIYNLPLSLAERDRLLSLALRGAETQWRPIEEFSKDKTRVLLWVQFPDEQADLVVAEWDERFPKWPWRAVFASSAYADEYVTHFIPLTALGEPKDE